MGADIHVQAQKRVPDPNGEGGVKWVICEWPVTYEEEPSDIPGPKPYREYSNHPFDWRSYWMFGWLANVRNYSDVPSLSDPRGLPEGFNVYDWEDQFPDPYESGVDWRTTADYNVGEHSYSWLSLEELNNFDYDQSVEDRRVSKQIGPNMWTGAATAEPGGGTMSTYRESLGKSFFRDLETLNRIGAERIVFGFDS